MPLRGGRSFPSPGHEEEAEDVRARAGPPREQHHRAAVSGRRLHGRVTTDNRGVRRRRLELRDLQNGRRRSVRTAADGKTEEGRGACSPEERKVAQRRGAQGGGLNVAQAPPRRPSAAAAAYPRRGIPTRRRRRPRAPVKRGRDRPPRHTLFLLFVAPRRRPQRGIPTR
jgi:hypothetical protein